ncbi:MAG: TetR/AcrR family transcriptional regulator [Planktomarina sp.]
MTSKTDQKRADLRNRLIDIAEDWIQRDGLSSIKARPLAAEAGCAVGAIYNVFGDLNELILAVNGRTFAKLGRDVGEKGQDPSMAPADALIALAHAYLRFAIQNPKAWRALFDVELTADSDVPEWYSDELKRLFTYIARPVMGVYPDMGQDGVMLMTRALFSSIHGIVLLGVENRISGVPQDKLETMIEMVLSRIAN